MAETESQTRIFNTIAINQQKIYENDSPNNYIKKILDIFNYTELFQQDDTFKEIMDKLCPVDGGKTSDGVETSSDQETNSDENEKISISDGVFQYIPFRFAAHCNETGFVVKVTIMSILNMLAIIICILADIATPNSSSITIKAFIVLLYTNVGLYILNYMLTPGNILFLFYNSITQSIGNSNSILRIIKFLLFFVVSVLLPLTIVILIFSNTETLINTPPFIISGFFVFIITLLIIQFILALVIFVYIFFKYCFSKIENIQTLCNYFKANKGDDTDDENTNKCELYRDSLLSELICNGKSRIKFLLENEIERFNVALPAVIFLYILITILGIPIYILAGTITSIYVFLNFIYSFFVYPIFSVNPVFIKILQERGILLTLIFCSLIIISIREAHIFGKDTKSITSIMLVVFSFILIFHIYKIINPK